VELVTCSIDRIKTKRPVVIVPIGDIQWSGKNGPQAENHLRACIQKALSLDADPFFLGMGDFIDFLSPSNRMRLRGANLYDTGVDVMEEKATDMVDDLMAKVLAPTVGRWLGLLEGHHFTEYRAGDTSDMRLAERLKTRFLGSSAYIRLQFSDPTAHRNTVTLWCHHGTGGGQTEGSALAPLERAANRWEGADIFLMGHVPKSVTARYPRPYPRWHGAGAPDLVHRDILLVRTGGFSKSYIVGSRQGRIPRGGYGEQRAFGPGVIAAPFIHIRPRVLSHVSNGVREQTWSPQITVEV